MPRATASSYASIIVIDHNVQRKSREADRSLAACKVKDEDEKGDMMDMTAVLAVSRGI